MIKYLVITAFLFLLSATPLRSEVRVSILGGEKIESNLAVQVKIPFDEEYRIDLDNRDHSRRALVHIKIDGRLATGDGLILRKGESVQLERFIDNGDLKRGPKFKFVDTDEQKRLGQSTSKEDGLIVVTVQYEKDKLPLIEYGQVTNWATGLSTVVPPLGGIIPQTIETTAALSAASSSKVLEPGITVEGSESKQRFEKAELGEMDERVETLTIRLLGYYKGTPLLMRQR